MGHKGVRHENDPERLKRRQFVANELINRGWSQIDAAQEAVDIEEKEEQQRNKKFFEMIGN